MQPPIPRRLLAKEDENIQTPELDVSEWFNTDTPLTLGGLKGRVGEIKWVEVIRTRILLWHDLDVKRSFREIPFFNGIVEITLMTFAVAGDDLCCFFISQILDPLLGFKVEFDPEPFVLYIDKTERVADVSQTLGLD